MAAPAVPVLCYFNLTANTPPFSPSRINVYQSIHYTFSSRSFSHSCNFSRSKQRLRLKPRQLRGLKAVEAADPSDYPPSNSGERWLLEPIGDGDWRHLGFRVPLPDAFEIASNVVNVGRLPQKADVVIPVATVSGLHARLEKKEGRLLVTDLDSTNGTFIDNQRIRPGGVTSVSPGSALTFGDTHLAMFRVTKLENVDPPAKAEESKEKLETDGPMESVEVMNQDS